MDNILNTTLKEIDDQQLRSQDEDKYGYLYITMNMIDHKKYIGVHRCKSESKTLDEWYKGSGKYLWRAINKYGWDNFKTRILKWFSNEHDMFQAEYEIIEKYDCVSSKEFYNIHSGGKGGRTWANYDNEEDIIAVKRAISAKKSNRPRTEKELKQLENIHNSFIGTHHSAESKQKSRESNLGQKRSKETKDKLKLRRSYPRLTDNGVNYYYINPIEIEEYLGNGYYFYKDSDREKYYSFIEG